MKKRKYLYAISYSCTMADGRQGDGCCQLYFSNKINTQERFLAAVDFIKSENNLTSCVILNIMLLGRKWI
jgi:hypothetical protein